MCHYKKRPLKGRHTDTHIKKKITVCIHSVHHVGSFSLCGFFDVDAADTTAAGSGFDVAADLPNGGVLVAWERGGLMLGLH